MQIVFLSKNVHIDFTDRIALFATLYLVENFKFCNKYQTFFAKYLSLVVKTDPKKNIALQQNYFTIPKYAKFYAAGIQKAGIVWEASAEDYR